MKLLYFSDLHLADRGPSSRSPSYLEDVWAKLEEIRDLATGVDVTLFGGDLFHGPGNRPQATSHRLVRRVITMFQTWPTRCLFVSGNHESDVDGGLTRSPLGVVLAALGEDYGHKKFDEQWEQDVRLVGRHWTATLDGDEKAYRVKRGDERWLVIASHGMVMPPGKYPFPCVKMDEVRTEADIVLLGHMHWETPAAMFNGTTWFGPGSVARTSRSPSEAERTPQVAIIDFGPSKMDIVQIPLKSAKPFCEVFLWDDGAEMPSKTDLFAGYVATLEAGLDIEGLSIEEALAQLEGRAPAGVVEKARSYLMEAGL